MGLCQSNQEVNEESTSLNNTTISANERRRHNNNNSNLTSTNTEMYEDWARRQLALLKARGVDPSEDTDADSAVSTRQTEPTV